ncbi:ester cyclase [Hymenobacter tenuis]
MFEETQAAREANKALVRQFYAAIERGDYATVTQLCHPDFVFYFQVDSPIAGAQGFINSEKKNFDQFEEFTFRIQHLLAEGNQVAAYLLFNGRPHGAPAGKRVRFSLMMLLTIADGKISEKRAHFDRLDIFQQLGNENERS